MRETDFMRLTKREIVVSRLRKREGNRMCVIMCKIDR